jgi:hypothetical protein
MIDRSRMREGHVHAISRSHDMHTWAPRHGEWLGVIDLEFKFKVVPSQVLREEVRIRILSHKEGLASAGGILRGTGIGSADCTALT